MFLAHIGRIAAPRIAAFPSLFYCSYTILHRQPVMPISQGRDRERKPALRGVVFDMDGTLTVPVIDFSAMYLSVLGEEGYAAAKSSRHGGSVDILHCIETWTPQEQQRAYEIISHFERQGLDRLQIMPGAAELCGHLDSKEAKDANKGAKPQNRLMGEVRATKFDGTIWCTCRYDLFGVFERGLITRNVKAAVDLFHQRFGLIFVPALSREFRPYKPDPAPLLHICSSWGVPPNEVMMIGDSLRDDVTCGKRAGSFTCLLDETGRYGPLDSLSEDVKPDFKVSSLAEVQSLLEKFFELLPHPQANEQNN